MSKSEKKCSVPDCKKAVFGPGAFFCGEHERDFQEFLKGAKVFGGAIVAAGMFIKKIAKK
ncbi:hypothetical protein ABPH35_06655 [Streptococcus sp. ZJ93]|uniref:hypothetical protein n=1 Tax=Streptococcus handemini TaxID=3161188 RepID=UPI0032EB9824